MTQEIQQQNPPQQQLQHQQKLQQQQLKYQNEQQQQQLKQSKLEADETINNLIKSVIPSGGYRRADRQSKKAIEWLSALERDLGIEITYGDRAREFRLPEGCLVDGYFENIEVSTKVVYQFHGCYWHECPQCFKLNQDKKLGFDKSSESLNDRFERTNAQTDRLRSLGYEVVEKWECSFDKEKVVNDNLRSFLKDHPLLMTDALNPRDAFYGGRASTTFSYYEAKGTVKISYPDVCSLYPFVSKYGKFPIGHPKVYIGDACKSLTGVSFDLSDVEGLVKCRVLPPTNKYLPVLPVRVHDKLMFPLCNTSCKEKIQSDCPYLNNTNAREIEGTWFSDEIKVTIQEGYKVTAIFEI
ncbi:uncharacterized protein LOC117169800 [Belonocnema kinseyi]|uniref:uncharacterized protein LOC117169800 n=1 Tax=Belonocnema kinseyi TaxID=2817044 RepID=UPI00143D67DB|nr:uncharacterized protein LOC117169800 [Belonocnema kinseyi]